MDNRQLQQWVEKISMESFGRPFLHKATFNARLKATGGRYFTTTHNIEISPHQLESYGAEETEKIIKHELCHYHLHILGRGYKHRDQDFKMLLASVGGARYCKRLPEREGGAARPYRYVLICVNCNQQYYRKRRMDASKYRCGKCRGRIIIKSIDNSTQG